MSDDSLHQMSSISQQNKMVQCREHQNNDDQHVIISEIIATTALVFPKFMVLHDSIFKCYGWLRPVIYGSTTDIPNTINKLEKSRAGFCIILMLIGVTHQVKRETESAPSAHPQWIAKARIAAEPTCAGSAWGRTRPASMLGRSERRVVARALRLSP